MKIKNMVQKMFVITLTALITMINAENKLYVEGKLLVKFKADIVLPDGAFSPAIGIPQLDSSNRHYGCTGIEPLLPRTKNASHNNNPLSRVYVFTFESGFSVEQILAVYRATNLFEYVEPDYKMYGNSRKQGYFPSDQYFNRQWALHNDGTFNMGGMFNPKDDADIDMPEAWEIEQGDTSIIIAILDSGCKMDHPELAGRLWKNPGEIPDNGIDDDGNGYVDDVNGWDFVNDDNDPSDEDGHGTRIAGIIGANVNNEIGFAGVNPNARIMVVKVLDSTGEGNTTYHSRGIDYAIKMGANIINMAIAHPVYTKTEHEMVQSAFNNNVTIIAGTGNINAEKIQYPAAYEEVIAVGATGPDDKRYSLSDTTGSNYGPEIDIVAPGAYVFGLDKSDNNKYNIYGSGTSDATAYVTGVVSLLLAKTPAMSPDQIKEILQKSADDQVGDPAEDTKGWDKYYGWGRLNAYNALTYTIAVKNVRIRPHISKNQTECILSIYQRPFSLRLCSRYYTISGKMIAASGGKATALPANGLYIRKAPEGGRK
ncbi:MAG: S8 family serine peptidase [Candidatus Latescibacteria bacterium]|nr:S8 family serine peptidase [Candidatus Latescibacterota bacterium]